MFWGCVLKKNQPYKVQHALEDGEYPVLHLSNAVLTSKDGFSVVAPMKQIVPSSM